MVSEHSGVNSHRFPGAAAALSEQRTAPLALLNLALLLILCLSNLASKSAPRFLCQSQSFLVVLVAFAMTFHQTRSGDDAVIQLGFLAPLTQSAWVARKSNAHLNNPSHGRQVPSWHHNHGHLVLKYSATLTSRFSGSYQKKVWFRAGFVVTPTTTNQRSWPK